MAQLGARYTGSVEVTGSIPVSSTMTFQNPPFRRVFSSEHVPSLHSASCSSMYDSAFIPVTNVPIWPNPARPTCGQFVRNPCRRANAMLRLFVGLRLNRTKNSAAVVPPSTGEGSQIQCVQIAWLFDPDSKHRATSTKLTSLITSCEMGVVGYSVPLFFPGNQDVRKTYATMAGVSRMSSTASIMGRGTVMGDAASSFATSGRRVP